jgi:hypothetical protein
LVFVFPFFSFFGIEIFAKLCPKEKRKKKVEFTLEKQENSTQRNSNFFVKKWRNFAKKGKKKNTGPILESPSGLFSGIL